MCQKYVLIREICSNKTLNVPIVWLNKTLNMSKVRVNKTLNMS